MPTSVSAAASSNTVVLSRAFVTRHKSWGARPAGAGEEVGAGAAEEPGRVSNAGGRDSVGAPLRVGDHTAGGLVDGQRREAEEDLHGPGGPRGEDGDDVVARRAADE